MSKTLLSVDTGLSPKSLCTGAYWVDGVLVHIEAIKPKEEPMSERIQRLFLHFQSKGIVDEMVLEIMQVYRAGKSKADPKDLIHLSLLGGCLLTLSKAPAVLCQPAEWNGGADKKVTEFRVLRAFKESPTENAVLYACLKQFPKGIHHNIYDGVGIGLNHFGRYKKVSSDA